MITKTDEIEKLLQPFTQEDKEKIMASAWDACCDGEWLGSACETLGIDPEECWGENSERLALLAVEEAMQANK